MLLIIRNSAPFVQFFFFSSVTVLVLSYRCFNAAHYLKLRSFSQVLLIG